jgi:hypothetical protein
MRIRQPALQALIRQCHPRLTPQHPTLLDSVRGLWQTLFCAAFGLLAELPLTVALG